MSPRITILIGPYQFTVRGLFSAGHVLTAEEASAYNEFRAKGVVWNMREVVNARVRGLASGELLDDETLAEIQRQIDQFDAGYRHPVERGGSRANKHIEVRRGVIEQEAWEIAGRELDAGLRQSGRRMSEVDYECARTASAATPATRAKARINLKYKRQVIEREGI